MTHQTDDQPQSLVLSPTKFVIFTIITLGLYAGYWGWRAWEVVRLSQGETYKVKSSVRGYFLNFSSFTLFPQLEKLALEVGYKKTRNYDVQVLAGAFFVMNLVASRAPFVFSVPAAIVVPFLLLPSLKMFNYYVSNTKKVLPPKKANPALIAVLIILGVASAALIFASTMQY